MQVLLNMGTAMITITLAVCALEGPRIAREHEALWTLLVLIFYLFAATVILYTVGLILLYFVSMLLSAILGLFIRW